MSETRFLVTGGWRLGCGLTGITDSPEWLRRAAASAIRRSVQNLLDIALASDCHFILVAGRIAPADSFAHSAAWLRARADLFLRSGVRLAVTGHDVDELRQLAPLDVVALQSDSAVWVTSTASGVTFSAMPSAGAWRLEFGSAACAASAGLCCRVHDLSQTPQARSAADGPVSAVAGLLSVPALRPQRLSAEESASGSGCLVISADLSAGRLWAEYRATESLEFQSLREYCEPGTTPPELLRRLADHSRRLPSGCSVRLLDWQIDGRLRVSLWDDGALRERDLLQALRELLNAGHAGVWPYRLRFADGFQVELCAGSSRLLAGISGRGPLGLGPENEIPELLHQLQRVA
ncbi:MAG: hypothetical protein ACKO2P_15455 [Planctomycetota bacterium]